MLRAWWRDHREAGESLGSRVPPSGRPFESSVFFASHPCRIGVRWNALIRRFTASTWSLASRSWLPQWRLLRRVQLPAAPRTDAAPRGGPANHSTRSSRSLAHQCGNLLRKCSISLAKPISLRWSFRSPGSRCPVRVPGKNCIAQHLEARISQFHGREFFLDHLEDLRMHTTGPHQLAVDEALAQEMPAARRAEPTPPLSTAGATKPLRPAAPPWRRGSIV